MEDEKLVELFLSRNERAISELDLKHGRLCHSISYNILHNNEDAEECVNDAYLGVWNTVPPQHPNPLISFVCRIVRNISIARYHSNTAKKRGGGYDIALEEIEGILSAPDTVEESFDAKALAILIAEFLDSVSAENRVIFMRRYWFCDSFADIAQRVGLSEKNISVRLTRIRKQLKQHLTEQGVAL